MWHFLMVHDDYGTRVGKALGIKPDDVRNLPPLPKQVLTDEDRRRLKNLGKNGDKLDPAAWGPWTSSVKNYKASAEEVLGGMRDVAANGTMGQAAE